ncbi:MAG: protoporphyrinogen oxidase [Chlamydiota bacterium]
MSKKEWIILGGGISGLSLLWYLRKYAPLSRVSLLEKSDRVGGVIHSTCMDGLVFDEGPKTFRTAQGQDLLELIGDMGLQEKVVFSSKEVAKRYIYYQDRLCKVPTSLLELVTTSFGRKMLPGLYKDLKEVTQGQAEETLGSFMRRRFGSYITDVLMEPFVLGTSGGDIDILSMDGFAKLKMWEKQHGSVIKGFLKRDKPLGKGSTLFNVENGAFTLVKALYKRCSENILKNQEVQEIRQVKDKVVIVTQDREFVADRVFSALPLEALKKIKLPVGLIQDPFIQEGRSASFVSVMCAYSEQVLPARGFGFLVPSSEKKSILGAVFDSEIFPVRGVYKTRLTVMMGGVKNPAIIQAEKDELIDKALEGLRTCLGIQKNPDKIHLVRYVDAISQITVGHFSRLDAFKEKIKEADLALTLIGNSIIQASVNHCIALSKKEALEIAKND